MSLSDIYGGSRESVALLTRLIDRFDTDNSRNVGSGSRPPLPQSSSFSSSFSSSTSLQASGINPVGSIDYGFFDHKTAYQRPRTRTTTRTIREAEGSKQESHPVKILYSHTVYIQF